MRFAVFCLSVLVLTLAGCSDDSTPTVVAGPELRPPFIEVSAAGLQFEVEQDESGRTTEVFAHSLLTHDQVRWGDARISVQRISYTWFAGGEEYHHCFAQAHLSQGWLECDPSEPEDFLANTLHLPSDVAGERLVIHAELRLEGQPAAKFYTVDTTSIIP